MRWHPVDLYFVESWLQYHLPLMAILAANILGKASV